jgi:hypothetical protein
MKGFICSGSSLSYHLIPSTFFKSKNENLSTILKISTRRRIYPSPGLDTVIEQKYRDGINNGADVEYHLRMVNSALLNV